MFRFSLAAAVLALVACSPPELSESRAQQMTDFELCQVYSSAKRINAAQQANRARHELKRRGALSERDMSDMSKGTIREGMKGLAAVCSWGPVTDVNTTVVAGHRSKQYVVSLGTYFYTRDGRVYAWQQ